MCSEFWPLLLLRPWPSHMNSFSLLFCRRSEIQHFVWKHTIILLSVKVCKCLQASLGSVLGIPKKHCLPFCSSESWWRHIFQIRIQCNSALGKCMFWPGASLVLWPWLFWSIICLSFHCNFCKVLPNAEQYSVDYGVVKVCLVLQCLQNHHLPAWQSKDFCSMYRSFCNIAQFCSIGGRIVAVLNSKISVFCFKHSVLYNQVA